MKPPQFLYARPQTLAEALSILDEFGADAKILAGGQSLMPLLNFRLARPAVLVDIALVDEIGAISVEDGILSIGAGVRQRVAELSSDVREACPLLSESVSHIGHLQNRIRGTVGGSLAHADPAAELPAVMMCLGATMVVRSGGGERSIPAEEFFVGPFTTTLGDNEMLCDVRIPVNPSARSHILELSLRKGDFALAGVCGRLTMSEGRVADVDLVAFGVDAVPLRLTEAEDAVRGRVPDPDILREAMRLANSAVDPSFGDVHADGAYRAAVVGEYAYRGLVEMTR